MNKYEILEGKLTAINAYIDTMCLESNVTMEYLKPVSYTHLTLPTKA